LKALILAGGFGTRLRSTLSDRPKPMALVLGKPFLEYLIRFLRRQGVNKIVLCLHFLANQIMEYFGDGSRFGVSIEYSVEDEPLGTAGAIKNAEEHLEDTFYVLNGDTYLEIDLKNLLKYHRAKRGIATMSLVKVQNNERYGSVKMHEDGRVADFLEKAPIKSGGEGYINAGVHIFERRILNYVAGGVEVSLEREVFPELVKRREPIYGYVTNGYFIDIGTLDDYLRFQNEILRAIKI